MTITGYIGMFSGAHGNPPVERIEIPIFQRDYAQGRDDPSVAMIREAFVSALCGALLPGATPVPLDFVYGEVDQDTHTLIPLDGQQRLTTLFLLHWYVAHRSGNLIGDEPWTRFSYRTRPSAELFCRTLVEQFATTPVIDHERPADWITEQNWYLYTWRSDPTVQGMLVVIAAIAAKCAELQVNFDFAWQRLTEPNPPIWFHYRPISDMGAETDLYIKMNSRGKPLTPWETMKAHFEETVVWSGRRDQFARAFDGPWSNVFWELRRKDVPGDVTTRDEPRDAMDDRFLRYFQFLTDVCQWSTATPDDENRDPQGPLAQRVKALFGPPSPVSDSTDREVNVDFLFHSFDVWTTRDPATTFARLYRRTDQPKPVGGDPLGLFFDPTNLFSQCCNHYGGEQFTIPQVLILYATLVQLTQPGPAAGDFAAHVRTLRNLIQATSIQRKDLPRLIREVRALIQIGAFSTESGFNRVQVKEEQAKRAFLDRHGHDAAAAEALYGLEDHDLLRGSLAAFDLDTDSASFIERAQAFQEIFTAHTDWQALSGALLAQDDYGWKRSSIHRQYGSGDSVAPWRALLTSNDGQDRLAGTRAVLMAYLDEARQSDVPAQYAPIKARQWLAQREDRGPFDWRYYFVKYPVMRTNTSGVFWLPDDKGRDRLVARRLRPGQTHQASKQRDPYLAAVYQELGDDKQRITQQPAVWWLDLYLHVNDNPRVRLRNVANGFRIEMPGQIWPFFAERLQREPSGAEISDPRIDDTEDRVTVHARIPRNPDNPQVDQLDRVQVGAALTRTMAAAVDDSLPYGKVPPAGQEGAPQDAQA